MVLGFGIRDVKHVMDLVGSTVVLIISMQPSPHHYISRPIAQ